MRASDPSRRGAQTEVNTPLSMIVGFADLGV